jgi:signal peptidase I
MDSKSDERDDGEAEVPYRFAPGASFGSGPQDPRWDSTDGGTGDVRPVGRTGAGLPQRLPDPLQSSLPSWNAFGPPAASPPAPPAPPAWEPPPEEPTGSGAGNGYRPSPFRRHSEVAPVEDLWSGTDEVDPDQQRWNGLAGHDDRPDWSGLAGHDDRPNWSGLAGHDDRPAWRPGQDEAPSWRAVPDDGPGWASEPRWGAGPRWNADQADGPSGELISVAAPRTEPAGRALEPVKRGREVELSPRRAIRRAPAEPGEKRRRLRGRRNMPLWQELPLLLVVAFCLAVLIRTFLLQAFYIPSGSMEQTLLIGDRVLVNKIVYDVRTPQRGEVIVFSGPSNWTPENVADPNEGMLSRVGGTLGDLVGVSRPGEKDFIKRVIGLPGDRVSCCDPDGRIYVNGQGVDEPYVDNNSPLDVPTNPRVCQSRRFDEVLVPPGQLFVMGDHRIVSQDSRCQGTIPIDNVIGRAFVIVWPSSRWGGLGVPDTFGSIPGPVALGPPGAVQPAGLPVPGGASVGAAIITLPIVGSLVKRRRTGRKRRWRTRTLRK